MSCGGIPPINRLFKIPGGDLNLAGWSEAEARTLKPQTMVLWTDGNKGQPPEQGAYLASLLPGARFHIIPDSCHWPQWEHPEQHDEVVTEFLKA